MVQTHLETKCHKLNYMIIVLDIYLARFMEMYLKQIWPELKGKKGGEGNKEEGKKRTGTLLCFHIINF